jgi:xanthosine utilization system XapX-like protein
METWLIILVVALIVGTQYFLVKTRPPERLLISLIAGFLLMTWIWFFITPTISPPKIIITVVVITAVIRNWFVYKKRKPLP